MPFIESDFKNGKFRFGGPSKFIEHVYRLKQTGEPIHLAGLAHSMFSSLHQMGFTKLNGSKNVRINGGNREVFSEFSTSIAMPLLMKTSKEGALALALAKDVDKVESIRMLEPYLDTVAGVKKGKIKKEIVDKASVEDRGAFVGAVSCLLRKGNPAGYRLAEIEELFEAFNPSARGIDKRDNICQKAVYEETGRVVEMNKIDSATGALSFMLNGIL